MGDKKAVRNLDQEWKNRVLCSDESCIGTIGRDGRCRECGLSYEGELPAGFHDTREGTDPPPPLTEDEDSSETIEKIHNLEEVSGSDGDWERRTLCRDESCIGVIDHSTGRCKECGKSYDDI